MNESQAKRVREALDSIYSVSLELDAEAIGAGSVSRVKLIQLGGEWGILATIEGADKALEAFGSFESIEKGTR